MTEQAGSSNKPEEASGPPPWERTWNDVREVAGKAVDAVVDTAKKAVEGAKMPWEMSWGGVVADKATKPSKTFKIPSEIGPLNTEKQAIAAAQFTPAEIKARDIEMKSPAFIKELSDELARAKNPAIRKILSDELAKLTRK